MKDLLAESSIKYAEISCTNMENNDLCNDLESFSNCNMYPMISYKADILICITEDYNLLGKIIESEGKKIIYCHSINAVHSLNKQK